MAPRRGALALLLLVLLVPAAAAAPGARAPIVISNYADDGGPGTLRHALERVARPGDTIGFAAAARLQLRSPLVVPARLAGLRIDGATPAGGRLTLVGGAGARLAVEADSVTLEQLAFVDLPVEFRSGSAGDDVTGPSGARVLGNELRVERGTGAPRLKLSFTRGARVDGNRLPPGAGAGLVLDGTERTTVAGNTFEGGGLTDHDSRTLVVERNTVTAGFFFFETETAAIERNTFGPRARLAVGDVADGGSIRVAGNTIEVGALRTGLAVAATSRIEIAGNTVRGTSPRSSGISAGCREQHPGLAVVERNRLSGLRVGLTLVCPRREGRFVVRGNTVRDNSEAGIVVRAHRAELGANTVEANGTGIVVERSASIRGATVRGNRRAGILVRRGAEALVAGLRAGGNGGPGIDLEPAGVSASRESPFPVATYDAQSGRLRGTACAGCTVEVYESEDGAKRGNPRNGEGRRPLGTVRAGADGRWVFPAARTLDCPASGKVTATATRDGATSEFSADVECGCLVGANFVVSGAGTPRSGFRSFGLRVLFPRGSRVGRATLVDVRTGERPAADALGEMLRWEEAQRDVAGPGGTVAREYAVRVSYRPGETGFALSRAIWRYSIAYEPPRGTATCSARASELPR